MKNSLTRRIFTLCLAAIMLLACGCSKKEDDGGLPAAADPIDDNYRTFYQIFVGSFSDSDGDGIGDLRGIINHFDYLNDGNVNSETSLGVQGIWLSPIFQSPSYHKYDARDYYSVDTQFGTEADLKELIELCHKRNVKIILDLAINHTSQRHEWFVKFKEARLNNDINSPYYDYYVCVTEDEKCNGHTYYKLNHDLYYEGNFSSEMPELNFDNENVRSAVLDVAKYYLEMGIDGFRFDAVKYVYYNDTAASVDFWKWYMAELKKIKPDVYCVGECWSGDPEVLDFYQALNCFNFTASQAEGIFATTAKGGSVDGLTTYVHNYQKNVLKANGEGMPMFFLANHDTDRIAGAFLLDEYMRMAANMYLLAPGSPVIYYGEEIGMRGSRGGANTDANRRLAMLWGDGDTVKNPAGSTYPAGNQIQSAVSDQLCDENSLLRYYCKLLSVRHRYPAIARGNYDVLTTGQDHLGGFAVTYKDETLYILHNNAAEELTLDLSAVGLSAEKVLESVGSGKATLDGNTLTVAGYTSVLVR